MGMLAIVALFLAVFVPPGVSGFASHVVQNRQQLLPHALGPRRSAPLAAAVGDDLGPVVADRRSFLTAPAAALLAAALAPRPSRAAGGGRVVVFGGAGYVGSHVDQALSAAGYDVVAVSRSSPDDQAARVARNLGAAPGRVAYVALDAAADDLGPVLDGAVAAVSCIGALGSGAAVRATNGAVNARIAAAAAKAGAGRFVYVSVASDLANGPAKFVLGDYLKGKAEAEAAVTTAFGAEKSLLVRPAIIDGAPPGEVRPPGPPGMKAVAVEDVARAVAVGVKGEQSGTIDGNAAISAL